MDGEALRGRERLVAPVDSVSAESGLLVVGMVELVWEEGSKVGLSSRVPFTWVSEDRKGRSVVGEVEAGLLVVLDVEGGGSWITELRLMKLLKRLNLPCS